MTVFSLQARLLRWFNLRRALRLVWAAAPGWAALNLALLVFQGLLPVAALLLLKQVVDALAAALANPGPPAFEAVLWWVVLAGAVALLTALANALGALATEAQALAVADHVNDLLHERSLAVDLGYYEDPAFHDTLHQAQMEAPHRPASIVNGLKQSLQNLLTLAGIAGLLFAFHWLVGLALLAAAIPAAIARLRAARRNFRFQQAHAEEERRAWYFHWLLTSADHARDIRLLGIGELLRARYRALHDGLRRGRLDLRRRQMLADFWAQGAATLALFGTLALMTFLAVQGALTLGVIVMYFQGYQRALGMLQGVLQGLGWLYEDNLFLERFYAFLDLPATIEQGRGTRPVSAAGHAGLCCRGVSFTYPSRQTATLHEIELELQSGEVVALVGGNGAGKSTLAKLLCRLYDPQAGAITWGGVDLREFDTRAWRRQISVVSQDFSRFNLSVAENIRLGDLDRPEDPQAIVAAARQAGLDEALDKLPAGLDTVLGNRFSNGFELSTGEWQRLALARAWYREAQLLILDEPSSALDPLAEAALIDDLRRLIGTRSALVISHRLSTVQQADRIYVMDRGRIVEAGRHADLLARAGLYARLYRTQAAHYRESPAG